MGFLKRWLPGGEAKDAARDQAEVFRSSLGTAAEADWVTLETLWEPLWDQRCPGHGEQWTPVYWDRQDRASTAGRRPPRISVCKCGVIGLRLESFSGDAQVRLAGEDPNTVVTTVAFFRRRSASD